MKKLDLFLIIIIVIIAFFALKPAFGTAQTTCPQTGGWTKIDSDELSQYPVDKATDYCFKAGSDKSKGCEGGIFDSWPQPEGTCGLSHWSYFIGEVTPTPTNTPQCDEDCEEPTPTVTPTPQVTPTVTPTPTSTVHATTEATKHHSSGGGCPHLPDAITHFSVEQGTPNDNTLHLYWPIALHAQWINILYTDTVPGDWKHGVQVDNNGSFDIRQLKNGTHYWFTLQAVSDCGMTPATVSIDPLP